MKRLDEITTVASIGGGPIGGGWAAHFLAKGLKVKCYLHDKSEHQQFVDIIETAWDSLIQLGLAEGASLKNMKISFDLAETLSEVDFVQESVPEVLNIKQQFYEKIDYLLDNNIV